LTCIKEYFVFDDDDDVDSDTFSVIISYFIAVFCASGDSGNSYKFQAGTRALALDWCRNIDRASKIQQPKVHIPPCQSDCLVISSLITNWFCASVLQCSNIVLVGLALSRYIY